MTGMSVPEGTGNADRVMAEKFIDQKLGIATKESEKDEQVAEAGGPAESAPTPGSTQTKTGGYPRLERQIFVGGIPADVTPHAFRAWADQTFPGRVVNAVLVLDRQTHTRSRGFGFVTFDNPEVAEMASQERLVSFGSRFVEIKRAQHLSSAQRATNGDFSRQPNISQLPSSPQKNKAGGLPQQQNFKTEKPGPTLYRDPEQAGNMAGRRNLNRAWAGGMSENWKQDPGSGMLRGQQRGPGLQKHNFAPGPKPNHFQVRNANNMPPRGGPHNGPPNAMMNPGPASPGTEPSMSMPGPTPGAAFMGQGAQVSDEAGQWPGPLWGYMAAPPDQGGPASMGPVPFAMHPGMAMAWPPQWAVPGMPPGWVPMPMPIGFVASPNMMPVPPGMAGFGQAPFNPALPHPMMMGGYGLDEEEMEGGMSALNLQGEGREPADSDAEHQEGGGAVVVGPDSDEGSSETPHPDPSVTPRSAQARAHRQADDTERDHDPEEEGPPPLAAECGVNGFNESSDAAAAEESESGRQG